MGTSDAKCAARNIRKISPLKLWAWRVGYSATKRSFLSRTHIVAVVLHTSSHSTVQATYVDTCSPVRTLGVLPTYEHTQNVRSGKQATNCIQDSAC